MIRAIKFAVGDYHPTDERILTELALVRDDGRSKDQARLDADKLREMAERMRKERDTMFLSKV